MRVGVVGCGYWGSKHIRVLCALSEVEQTVAIDANVERLNALKDSFAGVLTFECLAAALDHVDAVVIATPPETHAALALCALDCGKHVLIEKPLATSVVDAEALVARAAALGRVLMVGNTFEYNAAVWKLRELVASGELGRPLYVDTARLNLGRYQQECNVLWDLAPHDVSIINHILGATPTAVSAQGARNIHDGLEDVAYLWLQYESIEVRAHVHVSWLDPCKVRRVTVVGDRKMAVYNDLADEGPIRVYDKGVHPSRDNDLANPPMSYRYGSVVMPYVPVHEPLSVMDQHFVVCGRDGLSPHTDGLNGLAVVRVLEAAQQSLHSDKDKTVSLEAPLAAANAR